MRRPRPLPTLLLYAIVAFAPTARAQERLVDPLALDEAPRVQREGPYELYFSRAMYTGFRPRFPSWEIDYPKADRQFLIGLGKLTNIDAFGREHPVRLDDPNLRRFPLLYAVEVGYMALSEAERTGLRNYLLAGGFLIIDDFWGTHEWFNFETELEAVFPEYDVVDIPPDHPVLHVFYDIDEILQVPNVQQGIWGGPTWEKDGYVPGFKGVMDEEGRLMIAIVWNSDLGDAWEWAENPYYPNHLANYAYRLGVNLIVYAMTH